MTPVKIPGSQNPLTQDGGLIQQNWKRSLDDLAKASNDQSTAATTQQAQIDAILARLRAAGIA